MKVQYPFSSLSGFKAVSDDAEGIVRIFSKFFLSPTTVTAVVTAIKQTRKHRKTQRAFKNLLLLFFRPVLLRSLFSSTDVFVAAVSVFGISILL